MDLKVKNQHDSPFWWARYVPVALLLLVLGYLSLYIAAPVLLPLILSFSLALMLEPLTDWIQKRIKCTRNSAVLLSLLTATVAILFVIVALLPSVYSQLVESSKKLPDAIRAGRGQLQNLLAYAEKNLSPAIFSQLQNFIQSFQEDPSVITDRIGGFLSQGLFGLINLTETTIALLIVPFFVYYLLLDMENIRAFLENRIPERHRGVGAKLFDEIGEVVRGYVRGRVIIALILSVFYALGLWILDVPLWAAIGLIAGVIGIIPYVGIIAGIILALGFAALDGGGFWKILGVIVVFILAQPLEDYVLTPRFIGDRLDLHPMLVFLALIIAGSLFGVLGLVLAIPVLGMIKVFLRFFDELYLRSDFYLAPAYAIGETPGATDLQRAAAETVSNAEQEKDARKFNALRESKPKNKKKQ